MSLKIKDIGTKYNRLHLSNSIASCKNEADIAEIVKKISEFERHCLVSFSQSLLSGEYILDPEGVKKEISKLKDDLQITTDPKDPSVAIKNLTKRVTEHNQWVCERLKDYEEHIADTESRVEKYDFALRSKYERTLYPEKCQYPEVYWIVLNIARIDCFFEYKSSYVEMLLQERELLRNKREENKKVKLLFEILIDKCTLLLKKLVPYVKEETIYTVDNVRKKFDSATEKTKYFDDYDEQFNLYSKQGYNKEEKIRILEQKFHTTPDKLTYGEIMLLLKYYKDHQQSPRKHVEAVINLFDKKVKSFDEKDSDIKTDTFCIDSLRHYVKNCKLSFDIKQSDFTIDKLEEALKDIDELQMRTYINNFYPYRKALSYLQRFVKGEEKTTLDPDKIRKLIAEYELKLKETIDWCDDRSFFPINLPYNECLKKVPDWEGVIYTPSSYCRAVHYEKERSNYQELHLESIIAYNRLDVLKEHANVEALREEYKNAASKNLETMSIFSAIIAFLFGCVNFLTLTGRIEGFSSYELLFDTAIWGTILLLFSNMILVWTMSKGDTWTEFYSKLRGKLFVFSTLIYLSIVIGGLIFCGQTINSKSDQAEKPKIVQQEHMNKTGDRELINEVDTTKIRDEGTTQIRPDSRLDSVSAVGGR